MQRRIFCGENKANVGLHFESECEVNTKGACAKSVLMTMIPHHELVVLGSGPLMVEN